jgi:hypothetical protein
MAAYLNSNHLPDDLWYSQAIVVAYEQERGRRVPHQKVGGFEISASKTIKIPVVTLWDWLQNPGKRGLWLHGEDIVIHRATPHRTMRVTWLDGQKSVNIAFYEEGSDKCRISVQHTKLSDSDEATNTKTY